MKAKILALIVMIAMSVCVLASCSMLPEDLANKLQGAVDTVKDKVNGIINPNGTPEHTHNFVEGKCECGESDPNYVPPHEHSYVDGKCECGATDPSYVPPHEHSYVNGKCECGAEDPSYVPPHEHSYVDGKCECGAEDPNYVPPTPTPDGTAENPYALTVPGELNVAFAGGYNPVWYTFTASENKLLKVTLSSANADMGYGIAADQMMYTGGATTVEVELVAGTTYYVNFSTLNAEAEEYTVNATYVEKAEVTPASIAGTYYIRGGAMVTKVITVVIDANGTLSFDNNAYNFSIENNVVTVTTASGMDVSALVNILINSEGKVTGFIWNGNECDLYVPSEGGDEEEDGIDGTYATADGILVVEIDSEAGTVKFVHTHPMSGYVNTIVANFTFEDGVVTLTNEDGSAFPAMYGITITDGEVTGALYEGWDYVLAPATPGEGEGGEGGEGGETAPEGSMNNPIILDTIPSELTFTGIHDVYYSYTATEAITIIINKLAGSYMSITAEDYDAEYNDDYTNCTYYIYVAANETITLNPWKDSGADDAVWTYTFTVTAPVLEGSIDKPANLSTYFENSLDKPGSDADGYVIFTYSPWIDGTLTLAFSANVDIKYGTDLEALTAVADQATLTVDIVSSTNLYVLVKGDASVTFTATAEEYPGTANNPYTLDPWAGDHTCSYTGYDVWYTIVGGEEGGYVTLSSTFATAKLGAGSSTYSISYNDSETYGSVRFYVNAGETAYVVIGDWSEAAASEVTFSLSFEAGEHELDGTYDYPYNGALGDQTCNFAGGWSYVWYKLETTETGYLTVTSANENAYFVISPETSAYATGAKEGTGTVSYGSDAGVCYVGVKTADDEAGEIAFTVSFEAGELKPDGSLALPYEAVIGNNNCAFPGGYALVWYTITLEEAATLTISSTYENAWLVLTTVDQYEGVIASNQSWSGVTGSITADVDAGTYLIGVADWNEGEVSIDFVVSDGSVVACAHENTTTTNTATCTAAGTKTVVCNDCGETVSTEDVEALGHTGHADDFKCDTCSEKVLPEDGSVLTIKQAIALGNLYKNSTGSVYGTEKYYVTGVIVNVANPDKYGNITIKDEDGTEFLVYGTWSADGKTQYGSLTVKPGKGDTITVYAVVGAYYSTAQMSNGWIIEHVAHEHVGGEAATCTTSQLCTLCDAILVPASGHNDGNDADTLCDACGTDLAVSVEEYTEKFTITASTGTLSSDKKSISWESDNFNFLGEKAGSSTDIRTSDSDHYRAYVGSRFTISGNNGQKITKIVIVTTGSSYNFWADSLTTSGVTAVANGANLTITVDAGTIDEISFTITKQSRIKSIEITYQA